jgi:hypothetical protein
MHEAQAVVRNTKFKLSSYINICSFYEPFLLQVLIGNRLVKLNAIWPLHGVPKRKNSLSQTTTTSYSLSATRHLCASRDVRRHMTS